MTDSFAQVSDHLHEPPSIIMCDTLRERVMSWKSIVAGVDGSPESAGAAAFANRIASMAGTTCHLVHAASDIWGAVPVDDGVEDGASYCTTGQRIASFE